MSITSRASTINGREVKHQPAPVSALAMAPVESRGSVVPEGYLKFSDAVHVLCQGMFGSLPRPLPVREMKTIEIGLSVGFAPWSEQAGQRVAGAAKDGELPVYVFGNPHAHADRTAQEDAYKRAEADAYKGAQADEMARAQAEKVARADTYKVAKAYADTVKFEIIPVPASVLRQMIMSRHGFRDYPYVSFKATGKDARLFNALNTGVLVIPEGAFGIWYRRERAKGRWASQAFKLKKVGRPSKQTELLRNCASAALTEGDKSYAAVHRQLIASGRTDVSVDTVERAVKRMYLETGEKKYRRPKRSQPKWPPGLH